MEITLLSAEKCRESHFSAVISANVVILLEEINGEYFFRVMCIKIFRKSALAVECFILCFLRSAQETDISVFFLVHWLLPLCARQILQELGSHFSSIDVLLSKNDVLFY